MKWSGCRAVPVLLAVGGEHHVARVKLDDLLATGLDAAASLGHVQGLAAVVRVPRRAGTRE